MTYTVSGGVLNPTYSLTHSLHEQYIGDKKWKVLCFKYISAYYDFEL